MHSTVFKYVCFDLRERSDRFICSLLSLVCRVVLVSNYTQTLDLLQDLCAHLGYTWCRLDGQTPVAQRQRIVDSFNRLDSSHFLFFLSSKAGGVGLNLIGASHLVLYDIDWNPANDIQVCSSRVQVVWVMQRKLTCCTTHLYFNHTIKNILLLHMFMLKFMPLQARGTLVDLLYF